MKNNNPYFYLAASQLFPFEENSETLTNASDLILSAQQAQSFVQSKDYEKALALYSELINNHKHLPFFYACRSLLNMEMGDDEGGYYDYQIAKSLDFNYHNFLEWKNNAGEMLESEELENLISGNIEDAQQYINRATLMVQHFNYDEAIADFTKAIEQDKNAAVYVSRAAIYMRRVQYDKALADFNTAIAIDKSLYSSYLYRAQLYAAIHEDELAGVDFNEAVRLAPSESSIFEARAQFYENRELWEMAIADYSRVIDFNTEDFFGYVMRADLFEKINDLEKAILDYDKAISLNPYYSDLYQYRGDLKMKIGDQVGAEADFAKFEELENE